MSFLNWKMTRQDLNVSKANPNKSHILLNTSDMLIAATIIGNLAKTWDYDQGKHSHSLESYLHIITLVRLKPFSKTVRLLLTKGTFGIYVLSYTR